MKPGSVRLMSLVLLDRIKAPFGFQLHYLHSTGSSSGVLPWSQGLFID